MYSEGPCEQKAIKNFGENGAWAYTGTAQIFWVPPIISWTDKATNFKFCTHILNNSPLKISGAVAGCVVRTLKTFKCTHILGASRGLLSDSYAVLSTQVVTLNSILAYSMISQCSYTCVHNKKKPAYSSQYSFTNLLGKLTCTIRCINDLVEEHRVVECKSKPDRVCRRHLFFRYIECLLIGILWLRNHIWNMHKIAHYRSQPWLTITDHSTQILTSFTSISDSL